MTLLRVIGLACAFIGSAAIAHDGTSPTTVTVPGGDHRAVCENSAASGTWTFTITSISGNVAYVQPQIYHNAHPTKTEADPTGPYRLCLSCANANGRAQQECFDDASCSISSNQVANFKIMKPVSGASASVTVSTSGHHCVRVYAAGKNSSVTVRIDHP